MHSECDYLHREAKWVRKKNVEKNKAELSCIHKFKNTCSKYIVVFKGFGQLQPKCNINWSSVLETQSGGNIRDAYSAFQLFCLLWWKCSICVFLFLSCVHQAIPGRGIYSIIILWYYIIILSCQGFILKISKGGFVRLS